MDPKQRLLSALKSLQAYEEEAGRRAQESRVQAQVMRQKFQDMVQAKLRGEQPQVDVTQIVGCNPGEAFDRSLTYEHIWQDIYAALMDLESSPVSREQAHAVREALAEYRAIHHEPPVDHSALLTGALPDNLSDDPRARRRQLLEHALKPDNGTHDFVDRTWRRHEDQADRQAQILSRVVAMAESIQSKP